ncbi:MAG: alpha/beta fold hydrolase, partial [Cellulomonadaceae bacterium]|nr:alpha/beta fold hydrolase [Cellulomonadaceae bacterium]
MTTRQSPRDGDFSRARVKPPVVPSAAWEDGDPVGARLFATLAGGLLLEGGGALPEVTVAYETFGTLAPDGGNAILVLHALTGDAHVAGSAGPGQLTAGWWDEMVGPGKPIDTDKYFVVVPNVLGGCQGTTGPSSFVSRETCPAPLLRNSASAERARWGGRFPRLTVRDQVNAEIGLAKLLGITGWELVLGASMGGFRALEWAVMGPENGILVNKVAAIATSASASADQIAWAHPQLAAIRLDPGFSGGDYYDAPEDQGPHRGLAIARQIAHATYRSAAELDFRFQRYPQSGEDPFVDGRYAIQSY